MIIFKIIYEILSIIKCFCTGLYIGWLVRVTGPGKAQQASLEFYFIFFIILVASKECLWRLKGVFGIRGGRLDSCS